MFVDIFGSFSSQSFPMFVSFSLVSRWFPFGFYVECWVLPPFIVYLRSNAIIIAHAFCLISKAIDLKFKSNIQVLLHLERQLPYSFSYIPWYLIESALARKSSLSLPFTLQPLIPKVLLSRTRISVVRLAGNLRSFDCGE